MFTTFAIQSLLVLVASAAPLVPRQGYHHGHGSSPSGPQTPFTYPLPNGFPNIQVPSSALTDIQNQAHGTLPNSPLPTSLAVSG
jgi:hypothetical protein